MAKAFRKAQRVEVRSLRTWSEATYHHAVEMPPLWLGPRQHVVRMPDGKLKSFTASRIRDARRA